jgi:hypothetical protein
MKHGLFYPVAPVRAAQFETNNEEGDVNMNAVCNFVNQGQSPGSPFHAWHNGTDIFVEEKKGKPQRAEVGDWIVLSSDGVKVYEALQFGALFSPVSADGEVA